MTSELKLLLLDCRREEGCPKGGVEPAPIPGGGRTNACHATSLESASSNRTKALRATSSTERTSSSSAGSISPVRKIVGRRLAAAFAIAVAAVFAPVPINRMAVFVSARARAPVCNEDGEVPKRFGLSPGYDKVGGGKIFIECGIDGCRLICVAEVFRAVGGMANGGVEDKEKGGE